MKNPKIGRESVFTSDFFPRSIFRSFTFDFVFFTYKRIGTGVGVWVPYGGGGKAGLWAGTVGSGSAGKRSFYM